MENGKENIKPVVPEESCEELIRTNSSFDMGLREETTQSIPTPNSIEDVEKELRTIESATNPDRIRFIRSAIASTAIGNNEWSFDFISSGNRYKPLNLQEPAKNIFKEVSSQEKIVDEVLKQGLHISTVINQKPHLGMKEPFSPTDLMEIAIQARDIQEQTVVNGRDQFFSKHRVLPSSFEDAFDYEDPRDRRKLYLLSGDIVTVNPLIKKEVSDSVHYLKEIQNPVGILLTPNVRQSHLEKIVSSVNPDHAYGKTIFIFEDFITDLPQMKRLVEIVGRITVPSVIISAPRLDPRAPKKYGRKPFELVKTEVNALHQALRLEGNKISGLDLETSGLDVANRETAHELTNSQFRNILQFYSNIQRT